MRFPLLVLAATIAAQSATAQTPQPSDHTDADAAFARAAALVRDGHGDAGRQIVDSVFVRTRTGTPEHADALYWRAALAMDTQQAESDYRRLVVEYPLSRRVDRALLALAQLELARNDRERALAHLERLDREHPNGEARPTAAFWMARIRFEMNDAPRACASLDDALRLAPAGDVELRNQVEFYAPRCAGVERAVGGRESGDRGNSAGAEVADTRTATAERESGAGGTDTAASAVRTPPPTPEASRPPAAVAPASGPPTPVASTARFTIQVAAYDTRAEADALVQRLARRNVVARVSGTAKPFRVRTGNYGTRAAANTALAELRTRGIHGFVVDEAAASTP